MRWLWIFGLVACGKRAETPPPPPKTTVAIDATLPIDAAPPREGEVYVDGFYIDKTEATIGEYRECITAAACPAFEIVGPEAFVVGGLNHYQASVYCAWRGKRLPTIAEWKRAAYGTDGRKFPWGNDPVTCDRAIYNDCKADAPQPPGRPAGASASGALDMLGNVEEWADPTVPDVSAACVKDLPRNAPTLGGSLLDSAETVAFDTTSSPSGRWFDNRDQGVRCARGPMPPVSPPAIDPLFASATWIVEAKPRSADAFADARTRCESGESATVIAGELVGVKGWAVASMTQRAGARQVAAPKGLVRVVGIAQCDFSDVTRLTVLSTKTWKLEIPREVGVFQIWLPADTWATFEIDCDRPKSKGECSFGSMLAPRVKFKVPRDVTSVAGPVLEGTGGMTCD